MIRAKRIGARRHAGSRLGLAILGILLATAGCTGLWQVPLPAPAAVSPTPASAFALPTLTAIPTALPTTIPSVGPLPTRAAAATPAPGGSVFGLAWFHKPPQDGSSAAQIAAQDRYIHLTGPSDAPYRQAVRAAGYRGPIYTYMTAYAVEGPGPLPNAAAACKAGYKPYDNNLAWHPDDFCTLIHPHESWFLHNGQGQRLVDDYFGTGRWAYLMNPADPGWQAFSYARLTEIRQTWGYDGLWLDNLDLDLERAAREEHNSDGRVQEYATDADWRTAMQRWLTGLRGQLGTWPIWANLTGGGLGLTAWDAYAPYLDGAMSESFAVSWLDGWRTPAAWQTELDRAARWLAAGRGLVMVGQGAQTDTARLRFTLASYLLVATGADAFYRYTRFDSYYNQLWLYPDFDTARALGAPLGPRQEISPGVWQRPFAHGSVKVEVAQHIGQLLLTNP